MVIVFVIDTYLSKADGTVISAIRFKEELERRGHTVRILGVNVQGENLYGVRERYIPIVTPVAHKSSNYFGKVEKKVIAEAIKDADVVHFFLPWKLAIKAVKMAKKRNITVTGAFHCQPQNITYNARMSWIPGLATFIYFFFRRRAYRHIDNIHCPSEFIAKQLRKHKYRARLHVISNGISRKFITDMPRVFEPITPDKKIVIVQIGRYAKEKRHDLLIKAVAKSKYSHQIQIVLPGKGPREKKIRRLSKILPIQPIFGFKNQEELKDILLHADLYTHCSDIEIEGMSCMEAFATGLVPIITDTKKTATRQFIIDPRCSFKHNDPNDLSDKIDYLIEHPEERAQLSEEYVKLGQFYDLANSVTKFEEMLEIAIRDQQK